MERQRNRKEKNPRRCYGAEPYQKLSSVPRPNYVLCIIGKKRQRQARKVNKVCHAANRSRLLSQILLFLKKCTYIFDNAYLIEISRLSVKIL